MNEVLMVRFYLQGVEKRKKGGENEQKNLKKYSLFYGNNDFI